MLIVIIFVVFLGCFYWKWCYGCWCLSGVILGRVIGFVGYCGDWLWWYWIGKFYDVIINYYLLIERWIGGVGDWCIYLLDNLVDFLVIMIIIYFDFDGMWFGLDLCCFLIKLLLLVVFRSMNIVVEVIVIMFIVINV